MKCWHCNSDVVWQSDYSFEDYDMDGDGIVTVLTCSKCDAYYEITLKTKKENEK